MGVEPTAAVLQTAPLPIGIWTVGARGRIRTDTRLVLSESGMPNSRHSRTKSKKPAVSSGPRELSKCIWVIIYPHHLP